MMHSEVQETLETKLPTTTATPPLSSITPPTPTGNEWQGKSVSVDCDELGVFQGVIKTITSDQLALVRAFRNGVPLKRQRAQVVIFVSDIKGIKVIEDLPIDEDQSTDEGVSSSNGTPEKMVRLSRIYANTLPVYDSSDSTQSVTSVNEPFSDDGTATLTHPPMVKGVAAFFNNLIPPKVEARLALVQLHKECEGAENDVQDITVSDVQSTSSGSLIMPQIQQMVINNKNNNNNNANGNSNVHHNGNNGRIIGKKARKQTRQNSQTFSTSANDPCLNEDFDFESNLALFDKQAVWQTIETDQEKRRGGNGYHEPVKNKYRHDENILESLPAPHHQTKTNFSSTINFLTDDGQKIPTIPACVRARIEITAHDAGYRVQRQIDMLARGATEIAIALLGGARRLAITNYHQWPKVVIVCNKSDVFRATHIGAATGRQLASQGLKVFLYTAEDPSVEKCSSEMRLFMATDSRVYYNVNDLPHPDIVLLSTNTSNLLSPDIIDWLKESRASILAIDPPPGAVEDVNIKYAILPILPLKGINSNSNCKWFLCNIGIPDKFFRDAGIKYKSPFGHKFVIPLHLKD